MAFRLSSKELREGGRMPDAQVFNGMGHSGSNRSPELSWDGAPEGTKSFVLTVYDPDAPTGSGFWHWVVANIPASVHELPAGAGGGNGIPAGAVQTRTDMGQPGYVGAAPPPGPEHHYIFTIHALKVEKIDVNADSMPAMVGFMTHFNSLGKATLTVTYGK